LEGGGGRTIVALGYWIFRDGTRRQQQQDDGDVLAAHEYLRG
jgi:hypothetical protein